MSHGSHETEIKLAVEDVKSARRLMRAAGFRVSKARVFETNAVYDTVGNTLRQNAKLLRLRQAGREAILTYKGQPQAVSKYKSREELELPIPDAKVLDAILVRLGYHVATCYEKYRTEYRKPGASGVATIDETPVGVYIELEGSPAWIDRTARRLGFGEQDYITVSYSRLYLDWCSRHGEEPSAMVFKRTGR